MPTTSSPLSTWLGSDSSLIGGVYDLNYDRAVVYTDDARKAAAGGIPRGAFLVAVVGGQEQDGSFTLDDDEVVLLRVSSLSPLPNENELTSARLDVVRSTATGNTLDATSTGRTDLTACAFSCDVLGTFYSQDQGPGATICFGADLDDVMSPIRYRVYAPGPELLSKIASFTDPPTPPGDRLDIGHVRYTATQRRARSTQTSTARVHVNVSDFVGRKVAVFGQTRVGKSNAIKTLVTAVFRYAHRHDSGIGQLIFDPQGEYANLNQQDGTALSQLGDEDVVRIYSMAADGTDAQVRPLGLNFYDVALLDATWEFLSESLSDMNAAYAANFLSVSMTKPSAASANATPAERSALMSERIGWERARLALYGLLHECGLPGDRFEDSRAGHSHAKVLFTWNANDWADFDSIHPGTVTPPTTTGSSTYSVSSPQAAHTLFLHMIELQEWDTSSSTGRTMPFAHIAGVVKRAAVKARIRSLAGFHTTSGAERVEAAVWDDMQAGRISIVDLSHGSPRVTQVISERIVRALLSQASDRFRNDQHPVKMQVVVEEAHNLFERAADTVAGNPWVRLSKEAAKYSIGLLYATQEVSSVDKRVLSNTSNWLIAHLNSDIETRELSHYYDFATWAPQLVKVDQPGMMRMKTHSGRFIVPVQMDKFNADMVNVARQEAQGSRLGGIF